MSLDPVFDLKRLRVVTRFNYLIRRYADDKPTCLVFRFGEAVEVEAITGRVFAPDRSAELEDLSCAAP
jgi:hypothetical protein